MTRIFMTAVLAVVMFACGGGEKPAAENQADTTATTADTATVAPTTADTATVTADTAAVNADTAK